MSLGIAMLVHDSLDRAGQVARHWAKSGCPVVLHVDLNVPNDDFDDFRRSLEDVDLIRFCTRHRCEWGQWGIVAASQSAARMLLDTFGNVEHVYLLSGTCLPLRPVLDLVDYLARHRRTDFIESVAVTDAPWAKGGLQQERFTLRFPFSWRKHRKLFDFLVGAQRRLGVRRRIPPGLVPHMGSQWWCLTRQTLTAILDDPGRDRFERYFRQVWIPDESYFQTMVRRYSCDIESRTLTLSKFDFHGKPHVFYDDHLELLRRSNCFVARKIWPRADRLYESFLTDRDHAMSPVEPNPNKIDRVFARALDQRVNGRPGLYMQSRMPWAGAQTAKTSNPYSVFQGFSELFENFEDWLDKTTSARVHGRLFAPERAGFAGGVSVMNGGLIDSALLRDYAPQNFMTNLIWNTRGERQCFQYHPEDTKAIMGFMAGDSNAQISVIAGAWAIPLFRSDLSFEEKRAQATRFQKIEARQIALLQSAETKAQVRVWPLVEFVEQPMPALQEIVDEIGQVSNRSLVEAPTMVDLTGFGKFLQILRNHGMHPNMMGDFPVEDQFYDFPRPPSKPYLVR